MANIPFCVFNRYLYITHNTHKLQCTEVVVVEIEIKKLIPVGRQHKKKKKRLTCNGDGESGKKRKKKSTGNDDGESGNKREKKSTSNDDRTKKAFNEGRYNNKYVYIRRVFWCNLKTHAILLTNQSLLSSI